MTTRIEIRNPRDNKHSVNVWKSHEQGDDHIGQLPPGDALVTHIWEGVKLLIIEVPNSIKKDKNASIST